MGVRHDRSEVYGRRLGGVGKKNPYHSVLTAEQYAEGVKDEELDKFLDTGKNYVNAAFRIMARHFIPDFAPEKALDFGCGVGRLMIHMAELSGHVTGIDVSQTMIEEAKANLRRRGVTNATLILSDAYSDLELDGLDWINSYIVFQHIEPERGYGIFSDMLSDLKSGGAFSVQFTFAKTVDNLVKNYGYYTHARAEGKHVKLLRRSERIRTAKMTMFEYDINELLLIMAAHRITEYFFRFTDHRGHVGVMIFGKRS